MFSLDLSRTFFFMGHFAFLKVVTSIERSMVRSLQVSSLNTGWVRYLSKPSLAWQWMKE